MKTEKGITLIALIITIIVMLILVGVTVSVSLNGGLFTTAKQATNQTEKELEKERLLELVMGALNDKGQVDFDKKLDPAIAKDGTFEGTKGRYTSKKTGNIYTVSSRGSIAEEGQTTDEKWTQNGTTVEFGNQTFEVGDYVNYNSKNNFYNEYEQRW